MDFDQEDPYALTRFSTDSFVSILVLVDFDQEVAPPVGMAALSGVSILVLVDFDQEARPASARFGVRSSFNPCFGGL